MKYLIPFDFTEVGKNAVKHTQRLADISGGEIYILHLVEKRELLKEKEHLLNEYVSSLKTKSNFEINSHVVVGNIFSDIGKIADYHGADFVVMGTHGLDGMQKIFGSNVLKIINNSSVPFIVIQEG